MAVLREHTYVVFLTQEVEFVERGEGDVPSRLSMDTSIVGERCVVSSSTLISQRVVYLSWLNMCLPSVSFKVFPMVFGQLPLLYTVYVGNGLQMLM